MRGLQKRLCGRVPFDTVLMRKPDEYARRCLMASAMQIPDVPFAVAQKLKYSTDLWVKNVAVYTSYLNTLCTKIPKEYKWRFRTAEGFNTEMKDIMPGNVLEVNRLYCRDQLGCCEAYGVLSTWRTVDLARGCIWALARNDVVGAALMARSALENSAQLVDACRSISATLAGESEGLANGGLLDPSVDFKQSIVISEDFEKLLLKTLYATRLPGSEEFYSPTNILTIIARISKTPTQDSVLKTYELLCEVAHPNFLGKSIYLQSAQPGNRPGDEWRTIAHGVGPASLQIIEATVSALSWSCGTNVSAFALLSETLKSVISKIYPPGSRPF
jgi:hypothetical protein